MRDRSDPVVAGRRAVLLCVDCEGTREQIGRVALALAAEHVHATFFFTGITADAYPDLVRDLARTHSVHSHTQRHPNLRRLDRVRQREEILAGRATVEDILGSAADGFRAPYHAINRHTADILNENGFVFDVSGLYYRYDMGRVIEVRPSWFREWTELYAWLHLPVGFGWQIPRWLFPYRDPLVLPVHPQYTGRDDVFTAAMRRFIRFARARGASFMSVPAYLAARPPDDPDGNPAGGGRQDVVAACTLRPSG